MPNWAENRLAAGEAAAVEHGGGDFDRPGGGQRGAAGQLDRAGRAAAEATKAAAATNPLTQFLDNFRRVCSVRWETMAGFCR